MMNLDSDVHILSYKKLFLVFAALLMLTGATVGISYIDLGRLNVWIALLIASSKASLVTLFFMHLKYESRVITLSFISTIIFLGIMISFTFWDVAFR
jgi:cytochrome c oxidase subunit 4